MYNHRKTSARRAPKDATRRLKERNETMTPLRFTMKTAAFFLVSFLTLGALGAAEFDVDAWTDDGFPFVYSKDAPHLDAIWTALESDPDVREPFADAVYMQLSAKGQGKVYRGKTLSVKGRLLRAVFVPTSPPDAEKTDGYYDLWILLPDAKRDPVRVIAKRAPKDFVPDEQLENDVPYAQDIKYRDEKFEAAAVYYRKTAYDAGDDFYAAPTLVALEFQAKGAPVQAAPEPERRSMPWSYRLTLVAALALAWFFARRTVKSMRRLAETSPRRQEKSDDEKNPGKIGKLSILLAAALLLPATVQAQEQPDADAFWPLAVGAEQDEWARELSGVRPSLANPAPDAETASRRKIALGALARLSNLLTLATLKDHADETFQKTTLGEYFLQENRHNFASAPRVGYFAGVPTAVDPVELNVSEKERAGFDRLCRVELGDGPAKTVVYTADAPDLTNLSRFATFFDQAPTRAEYGGYGLYFGSETCADGTEAPVVLAPKLGFRTDGAPLCRLAGLNLGAYLSMPVYPANALNTEKDLAKRRAIARSLRWTTDDREPFYETLAAVKRMKLADDAREPVVDVVPLFNQPELQQGAKVKLTGKARRVNLILVNDADVRAATGLESYCQIFIYTDDSQGWPLVLCVPELPDSLPTGGGAQYRRYVDFTGYFYKTWAYKNSAKPDEPSGEATEEEPNSSWTRAPVLIGKITKVYPEEEKSPPPPVSSSTLITTFAILVVAWIIIRRWSARSQKNARRY